MSTPVIPGQLVGNLTSHLPGPGTHVHDDKIYASVTGSFTLPQSTNKSTKSTISIPRTSTTPLTTTNLPQVGSVVLCRVIRVQQRQLTALILLVLDPTSDASTANSVIPYTTLINDETQFQATLRKEDVRAYEKDKVVMNEMYRVGDIIRASVISLGDERSYYINTAGNEFGVVVAKSEQGNAMVPSSWKDMKDVRTGNAELRKVAKPS